MDNVRASGSPKGLIPELLTGLRLEDELCRRDTPKRTAHVDGAHFAREALQAWVEEKVQLAAAYLGCWHSVHVSGGPPSAENVDYSFASL